MPWTSGFSSMEDHNKYDPMVDLSLKLNLMNGAKVAALFMSCHQHITTNQMDMLKLLFVK